MIVDISEVLITPDNSIREAMVCIDRNPSKVALVLDSEHRLLDTITDGDIRRAILAGQDLDSPIIGLKDRRVDSSYPQPITAKVGTSRQKLLRLMKDNQVRQIPLLDNEDRLVDLATLGELLPDEELPITALVMAGGYGIRLRPLTEKLPKPMLPIGGRPLLELTIEQLRGAGIHRVNLATHYKGDVISQYFGDGSDFQMDIQYVEENQPLGTAGALSLVEQSGDPLLVINGDILTRVDFRSMLDYHRENQADMTIAVKEHQVRLPYGVVETDGIELIGITEKPTLRHFINAGIYLMNPEIARYVPENQSYDMPDLIGRLISENRRVVSFPVHEYWLDIGQTDDYHQAVEDTPVKQS